MSGEIELIPKNGYFWELSQDYDCTEFFKALSLFLHKETFLYIECSSIDKDIEREMSKYAIEAPHLIHSGTTWGKNLKLHFTLNVALLDKLIEISENYAVPEYADHVVVYSDEVLVEAYDFTTGPCYLSGKLSEDFVSKFAEKCKAPFRRIHEEKM